MLIYKLYLKKQKRIYKWIYLYEVNPNSDYKCSNQNNILISTFIIRIIIIMIYLKTTVKNIIFNILQWHTFHETPLNSSLQAAINNYDL